MILIGLNKKSFFILPVIVSCMFILLGCAAGTKMNSSWQEKEIKIDGDALDWNNGLQQIPDKKINIGFCNDSKFLYVCLVSEDRSKTMMILREGLIVWFEPDSGDENIFGIRYPMASSQPEAMRFSEMNKAENQREDPQKNIIKMLEQQNEFQIVNKDKFPFTALPILNNEGIETKLGYHSSQFVYELKVPLASSKQFSYMVDALPGGNVKIKFETEEMDGQGKRGNGRSNEMAPAGNGGGRGGNRSGGGEGRRPGMGGGNMFEPINYTVEIKLEKPPITK